MSHQGQTRFAQTVSLMAHNADFWRLRISKYPANAHKMNYFSALCTGSGKNVCLKILCVHTKFLRGVEVGWEYVDYHGVSKYNDGW